MHYDFFRVTICTKKTLTTYETFLLFFKPKDGLENLMATKNPQTK